MRPDPELVAFRREVGPISKVTGMSAVCGGDDAAFSEAEFEEVLTFPEAEVDGAMLQAEDEDAML